MSNEIINLAESAKDRSNSLIDAVSKFKVNIGCWQEMGSRFTTLPVPRILEIVLINMKC